MEIMSPAKITRQFLPQKLVIDSWDVVEPFFNDLLSRKINSVDELEHWLKDRSELEAVLEEDLAWRYIRMNIDTTDKKLAESFEFFVTRIEPRIQPLFDKLNRLLIESPYLKDLDPDKYFIFLRGVRKSIELYREENIPLFTRLQTDQQKYGTIIARMTIEVEGKELTLQQAAVFMKHPDREKREEVFFKIANRRMEDRDELNQLFDHLIGLRQQVAENAGFKNYRDYKFEELGRFDYSIEDCYDFHESVAREVVPVVAGFDKKRKEKLGVDPLRPWDMEVDLSGREPLKPFRDGNELLEKSIRCFTNVDPFFGECLSVMQRMKHLDLESRKGKAPGGFNYPLFESGVPFIFMNAAGTLRDLTTMVHEGGHAIHSFLSHHLELTSFKSVPSEVAELASMSMELISMEHWDNFFNNEEELRRAKREQLQKTLETLPWVATVDKFQHWIYLNQGHTVEQRDDYFVDLRKTFSSPEVSWEGLEDLQRTAWHRQLHLFEVPFYYIEYGFAQLGAVAVWRNYKQDPEGALKKFREALKLGYTRTIREIYETAGIRFDFSGPYIRGLAGFVKEELDKLED